MRSCKFARISILIGLILLAGCMGPQPQPMQMTGTLRSVRPAGGGAPTDWVLEMGMGGMGGGYAMPLDVSKVKGQVEQLDGKKVMVTGQQDMGSGGQKIIVKKIGVVSQ